MNVRNSYFLAAGWVIGLSLTGNVSYSQTAGLKPATSTPIAASAPTAVPSLVPYSGTAIAGNGNAPAGETTITFQIFKEETGGEPLWIESQIVAIESTGRYQVQLGGASPNGLPSDLFSTGEARWLEVQIAGEPSQPRVLLASVPYALKASDAATLGGLPASAFMLAGARTTGSALHQVVPTGTDVTTTGGTAGYIPEFSGTSSIVDSPVFVKGTDVGIGITTPVSPLDVNGTVTATGLTMNGNSTFNGIALFPAQGTATASAGFSSQYFKMSASAYNSLTKAVVSPRFLLQAEPVGNNTMSTGSAAPTETGFYFNANGTIHFATGQTFPGAGTGNGTITGVTAGVDLTGGGNSGGVTLNLDTTKVPTLAAHNTFTGIETFNGFANFNDGFTANAQSSIFTASTGLLVYTSANGGIYADLDVPTSNNEYGWAIEGDAHNAYSGVYGYGDNNSQAGVIASGNIGLYGITDLYGANGGQNQAFELTAAVYAQAGTMSNQGASDTDVPAAVFADGGATKGPNSSVVAVLGVTDAANAASFQNNGAQSTLTLQNAGSGYLLEADGTSGYCEITNAGGLQCNGTITGSNTAGNRTLTTYGVQAAENWYEDYGSSQLHSGSAQVNLDPDFGATVNTSVDYHVFLTPNGDCKGLYVSSKTASGFEVRELGGGTTSVAFDYKIVAKRKGYEQARLEDITEKVRKQTEERLKRQSGSTRTASHPGIPPVPQKTQLRTVSHP